MQTHLTVRPMVDVRQMYAQQIDTARMALIRGDRPAAADSFRAAINVARDNPSLQRELAPALVNLGKLEQELGRPAEAERLLNESLAVGERIFGPEHPSLGVVLNELSRLHIRQSHHVRAQAVLERLLRIARTKGEDHPEVATALAGLAVALRGLGNHDGAEQRYREALRIREKVLAPDHMAIVVTLEQLSDTCAAQGNRTEALTLLQRALSKREAALGAHHATVRALRSRIATLDYRGTSATPPAMSPKSSAAVATPAPVRVAASVAEATAQAPARLQPIAPVPAPRRSNELVFLYEPEATVPHRASQPRARVATPASSTVVAAAPPTSAPSRIPTVYPAPTVQRAPTVQPARSAQTAVPASLVSSAPSAASPQPAAPRRSLTPMPIGAMVISVAPRVGSQPVESSIPIEAKAARGDVARHDLTHLDWRPTVAPLPDDSHEMSPRRRIALYSSIGVAAAAIVVATMTFRLHADTASDYIAARMDVEQVPVATATTAAATLQLLAPGAEAKRRASDSITPPALPSLPAAPRRLASMTVPIIATSNVDSLVRASTAANRTADTVHIGTTGGLETSSFGEDASERPPVLIGPAPLPQFPEALRARRTEGEVVVRFRVDERGRVDGSSMKVVKSDHELFTLAVRNVLPRFRFEPARSRAPESKPRAGWVDFRTEFTAKN